MDGCLPSSLNLNSTTTTSSSAIFSMANIRPFPALLLLIFILLSAGRTIGRPPHPKHHVHHRSTLLRPTYRPSVIQRDLIDQTWPRRSSGGRSRETSTGGMQVAGSSLPDCSHACGSCSPCRRVMVSFVCSTLEEAETCPMAYKCMCNSKSYPVP